MSYIGRGLETGSMRQLDDISSGFDGSDTTHTMQINSVDVDQSVVGDVNQLILSLGGVIQKPGTDFTVSGSTLTFTTAPAANTSFFCVVIGGGGGFATPGDNTVTTSKLATTVLTGATDIGAAIVDADLFLIDDGAGGTLRKTAASRLKTYIGSLAGIDDQSSSNDDQLTITDTAVIINEDSDDVDFRVESNGNANKFVVNGGNNLVGINSDPDLGSGLHIKNADSGGSGNASGDELVLENNGPAGITILSANDNVGLIAFGDDGASNRGYIQYSHADDGFSIGTAAATSMSIDSIGAVTKSKQPAFSVNDGGTTTNLSSGAQITFGTEVFDQNSDFASNTFTAPVTGKYQLSYQMRFQEFDADFTYFFVQLTTSNRSYTNILGGAQFDADAAYISFTQSILCDMDANDTCDIAIAFSGGAAQCDVAHREFTGVLVC